MSGTVQLGLRENWRQFTLLVLINAFVGGMVGLERTILPQFAEITFGIASKTAVLSFIVAFGFTKAAANYMAGRWANMLGRRRLLIIGWALALPVPLLLIYAQSWTWVILANVLLGIHQGLAWSSTVVMKIDLVGEKDRGLAMGLNEFSGYVAVGVVAFLTGLIAERYGVTPYPFYLGLGLAIIGLGLSVFFVRDTRAFVKKEGTTATRPQVEGIFRETTFRNKTLSAVTQAGLVNNLNDGMMWGLLPMLLFSEGFTSQSIGIVAAVYPLVWGIGQLGTGKMADHFSRKRMLFWGMFIQGMAILLLPLGTNLWLLVPLAGALGLGTALVYPTFFVAIAEATHPRQRAESIGVFRLWRDAGYAFGAIISGLTADWLGIPFAIGLVGVITLMSALVIQLRMPG
ncbi:MAG: MFS transporter [Lewinella sp.]|nr:MFS transporter [Lewinella sp.]